MLKKVFLFIKNPVWQKDKNEDFKYRFNIIWKLTWWNLLFSFLIVLLIHLLSEFQLVSIGEHSSKNLFAKYPPLLVFLIVSIFAPVIEELVFRAPLVWFRKFNSFNYIFYLFSILFGLVHIFNYDTSNTDIWILPFLAIPQILGGFFLGYVRIKFGLIWSIMAHALFNVILVLPFVFGKFIDQWTH